MKEIKKPKAWRKLLDYCIIIFADCLFALAMHMFTIPAKFIPTGVSGIASMLENLFGFHAGYTIAVINLPILILALIFLEKKFAIRTIFSIICLTGFLELFNQLHIYEFINPSQPLVTALIAGSISGFGTGLLLRTTSSPGGTEVISMLIQKRLKHIKISYILLGLNVIIIFVGAIMYFSIGKMSLDIILVIAVSSIVQGFMNSKTIDLIVNGLNSAVKFEVITNKGKELSDEINRQLSFGVTIIKSKGAYSEERNDLLICVVPKFHISTFKKVIAQIDPDAFVFSMNTRDVAGKNFKKTL